MNSNHLLETIKLLRDKHSAAEAVFPWNTKDEHDHYQKLQEEFSVAAWNHLPFLLDQLESRITTK